MDTLYAPWRMEFIEKHDPNAGCVFCKIAEGQETGNQILHRGTKCFVLMNKYPYTNGHLMVMPYRHTSEWEDLKEDELLELNQLTQRAISTLKRAINPQAFNIGVNIGRTAGAGIDGHVHQHVVPRWNGDVNFMPLFAEVKVISEHLEATFQKLLKAWK